jgi:hypothetical protein
VRMRGADSRRITQSSRTARGALHSLDHAAVEPRACRPVSEAAVQTRGAPLATRGDSSRIPRDAVDEIGDAQRRESDAHGEAQRPVPTCTESPVVLAGRVRCPHAPPALPRDVSHVTGTRGGGPGGWSSMHGQGQGQGHGQGQRGGVRVNAAQTRASSRHPRAAAGHRSRNTPEM